MNKFKEYKGLDLAGVADEMLAHWTKDDTFHKSITTREGHPTFVFYEGPPSANGTPGIHHVMARTIKDVFCRYKTQQGYRVNRKAGWDTHGLPVELEVEKLLTAHGTPVSDMYERIDELKKHHEARLAEVQKILGTEWKTAFECARDMTWEIECRNKKKVLDEPSF